MCHYPSGASKWNPVEHRLFGPISANWAGKPLRCLGTLLGYIRGTETATGPEVAARSLERTYATKIKVSQQEMNGVRLIRHKICPNWNYTLERRWGSVPVQNTPGRQCGLVLERPHNAQLGGLQLHFTHLLPTPFPCFSLAALAVETRTPS